MSAPSLWRNLLANYVGTIAHALIGIVFAPVYLHLLGAAGFGLIGFFIALTALLGVFDLGLGMTLNRHLAGSRGSRDGVEKARNLLRTTEVVYWAIGLAIGVIVFASAPWIATAWLGEGPLTDAEVASAIRWMGVTFAAQWPAMLYGNALLGLQLHVRLNAIRASLAIVAAVGAVGVLMYVEQTVAAYFAWQAGIAAVLTLTLAVATWRGFERTENRPAIRFGHLARQWRFAAGLTGIAIASIIVTNTDKLIVAKLFDQKDLGHYTLATMVSAAVAMLAGPVVASLFPRLSASAKAGDTAGLAGGYRTGCRVVAIVVVPASVSLVLFAERLLGVWVRDQEVAASAAPLMRALVVGTMLNGLVLLAAHAQLATGWTRLNLARNIAGIVFTLPLMVVLAVRYGPIGAATAWVIFNVGVVAIEPPFMHRRIALGRLSRWWWADVLAPIVLSLAVAGPLRYLMPEPMHWFAELAWMGVAYAGALGATAGVLTYPTRRARAVSTEGSI